MSIDVSSLGINVMSGEVYSLILTNSGAGDYIWIDALSQSIRGDSFPSGARYSGSPGLPWFENASQDLGFQTFVSSPTNVVPEPGTIAIVSCLFACGLGYGPIRKKQSNDRKATT
ncbi:MAG: hypothetical protein AAGG48_21150 [Planctomycetota bacterium]